MLSLLAALLVSQAAPYNAPMPSTGTPVGGKSTVTGKMLPLSVDGTTGGLVISGSIAATNPSVGTNGAAIPTASTQVGWKDGSGNLQPVSAANPLPISGTISASNPSVSATGAAVPASGTLVMGTDAGTARAVKVNAAGNVQVDVVSGGGSNASVGSTGAAAPASATYAGVLSGGNLVGLAQPLTDIQLSARVNTLGQKTQANSTPVVIASDQSAISTFNGTIDANNSSTATLAANGVFTGTATDTFNFASFAVQVFSNVSSATNGLALQFSNDGTNWDETATYTFTAGGVAFNVQGALRARYFRIVYTNGGTIQAAFRLQTLFKTGAASGEVLELADPVTTSTHAQTTRSVLTAKNTPGTAITDVTATAGLLNVQLGEPGSTDTFGQAITAGRTPQVQAQFFAVAPGTAVTVTTTNGGTATGPTNGAGVFATSANVSGTVKGVSLTSVTYTAHYEIYAAFTAAFTTPTSAASYQRIGIYDTNNGFFLGYNGTGFGITARQATVDTFVAKASWNLDTLVGAASSKFTSNGAPVALDPTKFNVYRIRFGWLGAASIFYEILSPDDQWVAFHVARFANTSAIPSITSPNLPVTLDVAKTASDATNLVVTTGCWVAGVSSNGSVVSAGTASATGIGTTLDGGVATTAAPAYTTATVDPLSLTLTGDLRTKDLASSATGAAVPTTASFIGGGAAAGAGNLTGATVKAASTAAAATDTSLVVQPLVGNAAMVTAAAGVQRVGIAGNANGALDAANNATAPANVIVIGAQLQSSASATAGTAGQVGNVVAGLDHVLYVRPGGPVLTSGGVTAIAATLTQVIAAPAAGLSIYLTDIFAVSDTATAGQMTFRYGTGSNCATGTTTILPNVASVTTGKIPYPANTANTPFNQTMTTPLKIPAANALCVVCVATNTCTVHVQGFIAP